MWLRRLLNPLVVTHHSIFTGYVEHQELGNIKRGQSNKLQARDT